MSEVLVQAVLTGLVLGMLYALIALGYTMVYGIVELINFAHGDLFMLGTFMALTVLTVLGFNAPPGTGPPGAALTVLAFVLLFTVVPAFTAAVNVAVDRVVYKPLRNAPKLAPLVSAIGVSFVFMNLGYFWSAAVPERGAPAAAAADRSIPGLVSQTNIAPSIFGEGTTLRFTYQDLLVIAVTVPIMIGLTLLVKRTRLGQAMRATAQNPTAARLMGINVDRVIAATFLIGGALAGFGSVIYSLTIGTISYQVGFQNGVYAFTAAVLGGIGNIPGAVLGGLVIGLVRSFGDTYLSSQWTSALVFVILIMVLTFRPTGLLGARTREKV